MKKFLVTKRQLNEYIENKRTEKVFYDIIESMHKNVKNLNENVSSKKANQSVINDYQRKKLITPMIYEMLIKYKIIDNESKII